MQKDKTSILIRAREYVRSLESKVAELEEKNRLLESRLVRGDDSSDDGSDKDAAAEDSGKNKVHVEITRAAKEVRPAAAEPPRELCTLKIAVSSPCNMTDVAVRTLQCLKEQIGDGVSLVAMSTSGSASEASEANTNNSPRADLTLRIKSPPGWEEQPVKDAVAKVVADALTPP